MIIVKHAPEALKLEVSYNNTLGQTESFTLSPNPHTWETYYYIHYYDFLGSHNTDFSQVALIVSNGPETAEFTLSPELFKNYQSILNLDLDALNLTEESDYSRSMLSILIRLSLTLLIEGLILILFGYRQKASFKVFLLANIITQGFLNALIEGPFYSSYWIIGYLFMEIIILIFESVIYVKWLPEHSRIRALSYALIANLTSLGLGAYLISILPY